MKYNRFGNSGLVVSRMSFGAMNFGNYDFHGFKSNVDKFLAKEMVARALDAGINLFDTADMYAAGQSEEILGSALGERRKDVLISTKAFFRSGEAVIHAGLSRRHIIDSCDASLKRLKTDYIDLFLLHDYDPITPFEETVRALEDLVRSGKVRYVGQSNLSAWHTEKILGIQARLGYNPLIASQVHYSLLCRDIEHEIVPQAREAGLGIMVWGPLSGGFLTGKYTRDNPDGHGGRRGTFDFPPIDREKGYYVVDKLKKISGDHNCAPAEVAYAWVLSKPFVTTVLVGATKMSQLESNLKAEELELTGDEIRELDELTSPPIQYPKWVHWGDLVTNEAIEKGWPQKET
jgi:aryl-alcohol dehydrogenase-like predicted oxidoreductase